jgi:hypothetical protein
MITHNGTYLLHATHHGMPIYAATMGGKMVIGGWLLSATKQAIVAAFGSAEGTEVIRKTNDYLNRIATTDPQRALQLAGFINEDPMLVCSLVETSKTRWLVGDGKAYIKTDIWGTKNMTTEVTACNAIYTSQQEAFTGNDGSKDGNSSNPAYCGYIVLRTETDIQGLTPTKYLRGTFLDYRSVHTYKTDANNLYIDGKPFGTGASVAYDTGGWLQVFKFSTFNALQCHISKVIFTTDSEHTLVPFNGADRIGMLDLNTLQFHPNANTQGSFTIQITDTTPA